MTNLILSSSSIPRKKLLKQLGIPFRIFHPHIDESAQVKETPTQFVKRLAKNKALAAKNKYKDALIIGADQIAVVNNQILGKPCDYEHARNMLKMISGQKVTYLTGLCLFNSATKRSQITLEKFTAIFRNFNDSSIKKYLAVENPYDCAACVKIEGPGISLLEAIYSKDPTALWGLPLIKLTQLLENENVHLL